MTEQNTTETEPKQILSDKHQEQVRGWVSSALKMINGAAGLKGDPVENKFVKYMADPKNSKNTRKIMGVLSKVAAASGDARARFAADVTQAISRLDYEDIQDKGKITEANAGNLVHGIVDTGANQLALKLAHKLIPNRMMAGLAAEFLSETLAGYTEKLVEEMGLTVTKNKTEEELKAEKDEKAKAEAKAKAEEAAAEKKSKAEAAYAKTQNIIEVKNLKKQIQEAEQKDEERSGTIFEEVNKQREEMGMDPIEGQPPEFTSEAYAEVERKFDDTKVQLRELQAELETNQEILNEATDEEVRNLAKEKIANLKHQMAEQEEPYLKAKLEVLDKHEAAVQKWKDENTKAPESSVEAPEVVEEQTTEPAQEEPSKLKTRLMNSPVNARWWINKAKENGHYDPESPKALLGKKLIRHIMDEGEAGPAISQVFSEEDLERFHAGKMTEAELKAKLETLEGIQTAQQTTTERSHEEASHSVSLETPEMEIGGKAPTTRGTVGEDIEYEEVVGNAITGEAPLELDAGKERHEEKQTALERWQAENLMTADKLEQKLKADASDDPAVEKLLAALKEDEFRALVDEQEISLNGEMSAKEMAAELKKNAKINDYLEQRLEQKQERQEAKKAKQPHKMQQLLSQKGVDREALKSLLGEQVPEAEEEPDIPEHESELEGKPLVNGQESAEDKEKAQNKRINMGDQQELVERLVAAQQEKLKKNPSVDQKRAQVEHTENLLQMGAKLASSVLSSSDTKGVESGGQHSNHRKNLGFKTTTQTQGANISMN